MKMFCGNCNQNPVAFFQISLGEEKFVLAARQNSCSERVEPGLRNKGQWHSYRDKGTASALLVEKNILKIYCTL